MSPHVASRVRIARSIAHDRVATRDPPQVSSAGGHPGCRVVGIRFQGSGVSPDTPHPTPDSHAGLASSAICTIDTAPPQGPCCSTAQRHAGTRVRSCRHPFGVQGQRRGRGCRGGGPPLPRGAGARSPRTQMQQDRPSRRRGSSRAAPLTAPQRSRRTARLSAISHGRDDHRRGRNALPRRLRVPAARLSERRAPRRSTMTPARSVGARYIVPSPPPPSSATHAAHLSPCLPVPLSPFASLRGSSPPSPCLLVRVSPLHLVRFLDSCARSCKSRPESC